MERGILDIPICSLGTVRALPTRPLVAPNPGSCRGAPILRAKPAAAQGDAVLGRDAGPPAHAALSCGHAPLLATRPDRCRLCMPPARPLRACVVPVRGCCSPAVRAGVAAKHGRHVQVLRVSRHRRRDAEPRQQRARHVCRLAFARSLAVLHQLCVRTRKAQCQCMPSATGHFTQGLGPRV